MSLSFHFEFQQKESVLRNKLFKAFLFIRNFFCFDCQSSDVSEILFQFFIGFSILLTFFHFYHILFYLSFLQTKKKLEE